MVNVKNIFRFGLFCFGVFLQFASFFISQVEQASWMLNIVSPKYVHGMSGVRSIEAGKTLYPNSEGFSEMSIVILNWLKQQNPSEVLHGIYIKKFEPKPGSSMKSGSVTIYDIKRFSFLLSNDQVFSIDTGRLLSDFEQMRKSSIFRWSLGLLIAGIAVVQFPLFFIESKPRVTNLA
jgi:hypothetical protein